MRRTGSISLLVALGIVAAAPAVANATTETASVGNVTAQLSYDKANSFLFKNVRVKIVRNGTTEIDQAAPAAPDCPLCSVGPAYGGRGTSVHVVQLDSSAEPEVVFDLFSGGAHCCFYSQIFSFKGGTYSSLIQEWGDPGYQFFDPEKDGQFEFRSADPAFAYAFGSFASSRYPPQIWRFSGGAMVNVTRQYPDLIRADIKRLKRLFKKFKELGVKSVLAANIADNCLLGNCDNGSNLVRTAVSKGYLKQGGKFLRHARRFLTRTGYIS